MERIRKAKRLTKKVNRDRQTETGSKLGEERERERERER